MRATFEILHFNYFHKWKIKHNAHKTELLVSNCNGRHSLHNMDINGQIISNKNKSFKNLGVYIDANLNFANHINQIVIKTKLPLIYYINS